MKMSMQLAMLTVLCAGCTTTQTVMKKKTLNHEMMVPIRAKVIANTGSIATSTAALHGSMADLMEAHLLASTVFDVRPHDFKEEKRSEAGGPKFPTVLFRGHLTALPQKSDLRDGVWVPASPKSLFTVHAFREDGQFLASQSATGDWPEVVADGMIGLMRSKKLDKQEERHKYTTSKMVRVDEDVPNPTGAYLIIGGVAAALAFIVLQ